MTEKLEPRPPQAEPAGEIAELVKRLLTVANTLANEEAELMEKAADALTRLLAQLLHMTVTNANNIAHRDELIGANHEFKDRIASLEAENARARELLDECYANAGMFSIDLAAKLTAFREEHKP